VHFESPTTTIELLRRGLPIALSDIYAEIKQLQILLAGLLFICGCWMIARALEKSAKLRASTLQRANPSVPLTDGPRPRVAPPGPRPEITSGGSLTDLLEELRSRIRSALSQLAMKTNVVEPDTVRTLCAPVVSIPIESRNIAAPDQISQIDALGQELARLKSTLEGRHAAPEIRERLVLIDAMARKLLNEMASSKIETAP